VRGVTHDGFSELWFDDLESMRRSMASPEWQALRDDGQTLFAAPMSVVVARERVQKG
jgi:EthD domain